MMDPKPQNEEDKKVAEATEAPVETETPPEEEPKATASQPDAPDSGPAKDGPEPSMAGPEESAAEKDTPEVPPNPNFMGTMEPGELAMMTTLRQQTRKIQNDIGGMEIQKARLIGNLSGVEAQLDNHLNMVGQRLGVPQGTQFQVTQDGQCYRMPPQGMGNFPGLQMVPPGPGARAPQPPPPAPPADAAEKKPEESPEAGK